MSEVKKCPKCGGEMVRGSAENLGLAFGCTRAEPKKPEDLPADRLEPYYCGNCGYMEFYKKLNLAHAHIEETKPKFVQSTYGKSHF